MSARTSRRLIVSLAIGLLVSALMSLALVNGYLLPLRLQSSDLLFRLKSDTSAKWAVLVAIDDRSLAELRSKGRFFNWPRDLHARVIDNLKAAGARIIVWDVLFDAPANGDDQLAESIRNAGNVVLAEPAENRLPPSPTRTFRFTDAIQQLPAFREAAVGIGHANVIPDSDGVIRATPLVIEKLLHTHVRRR